MGQAKQRREAAMRGEENCGSCKFFRRAEPMNPVGVCRALPPTVMMVGMSKHPISGQQVPVTNTYWPQIPDSEWCGAWLLRTAMGANIDLTKIDVDALEGSA